MRRAPSAALLRRLQDLADGSPVPGGRRDAEKLRCLRRTHRTHRPGGSWRGLLPGSHARFRIFIRHHNVSYSALSVPEAHSTPRGALGRRSMQDTACQLPGIALPRRSVDSVFFSGCEQDGADREHRRGGRGVEGGGSKALRGFRGRRGRGARGGRRGPNHGLRQVLLRQGAEGQGGEESPDRGEDADTGPEDPAFGAGGAFKRSV